MQETEITVQVLGDLPTIFAKLQSLGFTQIREYGLHDWYFTHLKVNPKIDYAELMKNSFLVRHVTGTEEKVQLHYKDKTMDAAGNVTSEEKITVQLSNLPDALKIFRQAGLACWCELQQTLFVFRKGDTEFAVQSVAGLGNFIEYEADASMAAMTPAQKMAQMYARLRALGLSLGTDLSCKKVYLKFLQDQTR